MGGMTNLTTIPLTGIQFRISAGDYSATVTELGAGLREFRHRDQPVITQYEPDELPPAGAGQLLAPWPNRIDGGRYSFGGASYQLDLSEPARGNAIHGLTRWADWQVVAHAADAVRLRHVLHGRPGYPFCLELSRRVPAERRRRAAGHDHGAQRGHQARAVRHRLTSVPDHRRAYDRRVRARAARRALAAGRRPRHPAGPAEGRHRHASTTSASRSPSATPCSITRSPA